MFIIGQRRDSEKRKSNYMVAQSDLWDTNTFAYTCAPRPPSNTPIQNISSFTNSI